MGFSGDQVYRSTAALPVPVAPPIERVRDIEPARACKIVVAGLDALSMILTRAHLIQALSAQGFDVVCAAAAGYEIAGAFSHLGARHGDVPRSLWGAWRWLARERPDIVLSLDMSASANLMLAATLAGVPRRVALIEDLGPAYAPGRAWRGGIARLAADARHRVCSRFVHAVIAANEDDRALIAERFMRGDKARVLNAPGVGVDLDALKAEPLPEGRLTFVMPGPLVREKGVFEFAAAARRLKARELDVRFILVGGFDDGPSAVPRATVEAWVEDGRLEHVEEAGCARAWMKIAHVVVLPSYREGVARMGMEAMAMGRPCIVSHAPGLREVVAHHRNGILVAPQSAAALDEAMTLVVRTPALIAPMSRAARWTAQTEFDASLKAAEMVRQLQAL